VTCTHGTPATLPSDIETLAETGVNPDCFDCDTPTLTGDQPRSAFATDREALDYVHSQRNVCVWNDSGCWSCNRWDH
jgi:hypothetical protein